LLSLTRHPAVCTQDCRSDYFPVRVPAGTTAAQPVLLVGQQGEPPRLGITSKEATGSLKGGPVCLIAVACGPDGTPLEGVSAGVSNAFEVRARSAAVKCQRH
jgi:hypothetical protein